MFDKGLAERAQEWCVKNNINPDEPGVKTSCHRLAEIGLVPDGTLAAIVKRGGIYTPSVMIGGLAKFCTDRGMIIRPPVIIYDGDVVDGQTVCGQMPVINLGGWPKNHLTRGAGVVVGGYCSVVHPVLGVMTTVVTEAQITFSEGKAGGSKFWGNPALRTAMIQKTISRYALTATVRYLGVAEGERLMEIMSEDDEQAGRALPRRRHGGAVDIAAVTAPQPQVALPTPASEAEAIAPKTFDIGRAIQYAQANGEEAAVGKTLQYYGEDAAMQLRKALSGEG